MMFIHKLCKASELESDFYAKDFLTGLQIKYI